MAFLSIKEYVGNGILTDYLFDIPYIKEADVHGYVDGVEVSISFVDPTTVRFAVAPADQSAIQIKRLTDNATPRFTFPNRTYITSTRLDGNSQQGLYLDQESIDATSIAQTTADESADAAAASAAAAATSETNAATSAANAATSETNAATSALNAATSETNAATSASDAANQKTYAEEWAQKPEDSPVSVAAGGNGTTDFSALHWAAKAAGSIQVTTKGDLLAYDTAPTRLAIGANGYILTADSAEGTGLKWTPPAAGGLFTEDGNSNIFGGTGTLPALTTGSSNFASGVNAGNDIAAGSNNVLLGENAGAFITSSLGNVFIGRDSGGFGSSAALSSSGSFHVALGYEAGYFLQGNAKQNTFVGYTAGRNCSTGDYNSYFGADTGHASTAHTGNYNILFGYKAGDNIQGASNQNSLLGAFAGQAITSGDGNICIGSYAGPTGDVSNQLFIDTVQSNTPLIWGDFSLDILKINGNLQVTHVTFGAETANTGTTPTINWTTNGKQKATITAATTVTFTAPAGPTNLTLKLINGGTGVITWPTTVKWPGGTEPTWTTTGTDIVSFYFDGTDYYGAAGLAYA